ncbi:porin [Shewanella sp. OPT22]|nr:porin [Shewanella sp. OPT22]
MKALNKTLLASAVVSLFSASAFAGDVVSVYGKLNVTAQKIDTSSADETKIQSNASRLGVKGSYDLGNDLEAFYTIEYEVDVSSDDKDNFEARNQFIGLRGGFGTVMVGRNDTVTKKSQGKIDLFNDLDGDIKKLFKGDNRLAQTVTYYTPSFSGFKFGATYVAEGDSKQKATYVKNDKTYMYEGDGFGVTAMYGDSKLKKSKVFASVAYDSDVAGYDVLRATVQGKIGALKLGGMFQQQESIKVGSESTNGYVLSAAYTIDKTTLKLQRQDMEDKGDSWSVGADYKLAKPTKVFAFYTTRQYDGESVDNNYYGVGIEHKF